MTTVETHSPAWHKLRSQGIGGSEIATLAGVGPERSSAWQIWAEKVGILPPDHGDDEDADRKRRGRLIERFLIEEFAEQTGLYVAGQQMMISHPTMPWVRNTLDGLVFESSTGCSIEDALGPLEIKMRTADSAWDTADDIPLDIAAQIQWQLLATQMEIAWLIVFHSFGDVKVYTVPRDDEAIATLLAVGHDFWHDHVLTNVAPPLGGHGREATQDALRAVYGQGGGGEVDVDDLAEKLAARRLLKAEAKAIEEQITDIDNELLAALGDAEVGLVGGVPLVTLKRATSRRLDTKRHEAEAATCHQAFVVEGESRRLDVRWPCERCGKPLRAQDEAKHRCKTPMNGETA